MDISLMSPNMAGPNWWCQIHVSALNASKGDIETNIKAYTYFVYKMVPDLFPCGICRKHAVENLSKMPNLKYSPDLFGWSVNLHNVVNKMLKKPEFRVNDAKRMYDGVLSLEAQFLSTWFVIHSAASTVTTQNASRRVFNNLIHGVVPTIMACDRFRDTFKIALTSVPKLSSVGNEILIDWTVELRNIHSNLLKMPSLSIKLENARKFRKPCEKCKISN